MKYILHKKLYEYPIIILDMDGTLYYQYPLRICMIFALLRYFLTHLLNIKELWMLFKLRKSHKNGRFIKGNARIDYWMQEKPLKYIPLFQDKKLSMLVDQLRHKGVRIVVYSDYPVAGKLNVLRMPPVDFTFCGFDEEIQCLKPDTKGLTYIMATLNEPAENILFIGDRYEKDGKCAEGVGMDYIILDKYPLLRNIFFYKKELSHVE